MQPWRSRHWQERLPQFVFALGLLGSVTAGSLGAATFHHLCSLCRHLGLNAGLNRSFREAPGFLWLLYWNHRV